MIRTMKFALRRDPANSRAIGYHATQQNAAYNVAVDVLNREPNLPKRSNRNTPDAINKRVPAWRQANRQTADAPYYIHQEGSEQAWEANQRLQQGRAERLERVEKAITQGEEPKQRDVRPHRRTLAHRSRKDCRLSLTITDRRLFEISDDGQTISSRQCGFSAKLRGRRTLKWLDIRSIRRQLPAVLAFHGTEQPSQVVQRPPTRLGTPESSRNALVHPFDSLGPTGHLCHIFYHTYHRLTSPALDCLDSTRLCSATVVLDSAPFGLYPRRTTARGYRSAAGTTASMSKSRYLSRCLSSNWT